MTSSAPRVMPSAAPDILEAWRTHVAEAYRSAERAGQALRVAEAFLTRFPDPQQWASLPMGDRLAVLDEGHKGLRGARRRLVRWLFVTERLAPEWAFHFRDDRSGGALVQLWESMDPDGLQRVRDTITRVGRSLYKWAEMKAILARTLLGTGKRRLDDLTEQDFENYLAAARTHSLLRSVHRPRKGKYPKSQHTCDVHSLMYLLGQVPRAGGRGYILPLRPAAAHVPARSLEVWCEDLPAGIAKTTLDYLRLRAATLSPRTIHHYRWVLVGFGTFLRQRFPEVRCFRALRRAHIDAYVRHLHDSGASVHLRCRHIGLLRIFFDDIGQREWDDAPARTLLFASDVPRQPRGVPLFLPDAVLFPFLQAVDRSDDPYLRGFVYLAYECGLRREEILSLELDCVLNIDGAPAALRVPPCKMKRERYVPLHRETKVIEAIDVLVEARGQCRPLPHPRYDGAPRDFLFARKGHRVGVTSISQTIHELVRTERIVGAHGRLAHVTPHRFRHTRATELVNANMSLPALMRFLGHVTPTMTLRYAHVFSETVRREYESALDKSRERLRWRYSGKLVDDGRPIDADLAAFFESDYLKSFLGNGYCLRTEQQGACRYANLCLTCPAFICTTNELPILRGQLEAEQRLIADATARQWPEEEKRHRHTLEALEAHVGRLSRAV